MKLTSYEKGVLASLQHAAIYVVEPQFAEPWLVSNRGMPGNRAVERVRIGVTTAPAAIEKPAKAWALGQDVRVTLRWVDGIELGNRVLKRLRLTLAEEAAGLVSGWLDMNAKRALEEITITATMLAIELRDDAGELAVVMEEVERRSRLGKRAVGGRR